ncbi:MAG: hypothetical protein ACT4OV_16635 [Microthrixaceae bacterium]
MTHLRAFGLEVDLPAGWDGEIYRRPGDATTSRRDAVSGKGTANAVAHLANFPLPAERGDYGSGAVERMTARDVLVCVLEFDREAAATAMFRHDGVPQFADVDFAPHTMQRTIAGLSGAQAFFREQGRAFCAYAVIGATRLKAPLVAEVNRLLRTLRID